MSVLTNVFFFLTRFEFAQPQCAAVNRLIGSQIGNGNRFLIWPIHYDCFGPESTSRKTLLQLVNTKVTGSLYNLAIE